MTTVGAREAFLALNCREAAAGIGDGTVFNAILDIKAPCIFMYSLEVVLR